jgi:hypothetical protein
VVDTTSGHRTDTFAVLAQVARAVGDRAMRPKFREDPIGTVEGFDQLPPDVQDMFRSMGDEELAALGTMCETLAANGYSVEVRGNRVCMF